MDLATALTVLGLVATCVIGAWQIFLAYRAPQALPKGTPIQLNGRAEPHKIDSLHTSLESSVSVQAPDEPYPMWDVFISHASEDKEEVARPLAQELRSRGLRVWYDEFSLELGDSLRRSIDQGLAKSRFGVVVLSKNFLAKEWPQRELDGLTSREISGVKVILPVWHDISRSEIVSYSPVLADRLAIMAAGGIPSVADAIELVIRRAKG